MAFSDIRERLQALLETVDGIGQVHAYRRHTRFWGEYYSRHTTMARLNNWEITRTKAGEEIDTVQAGVGVEPLYQRTHSLLILGHMGLNDQEATEKTFQDLLENISATVRHDNLLEGWLLLPRQLQIQKIGHEMFGPVLVHVCEITFEAIERTGGDQWMPGS